MQSISFLSYITGYSRNDWKCPKIFCYSLLGRDGKWSWENIGITKNCQLSTEKDGMYLIYYILFLHLNSWNINAYSPWLTLCLRGAVVCLVYNKILSLVWVSQVDCIYIIPEWSGFFYHSRIWINYSGWAIKDWENRTSLKHNL